MSREAAFLVNNWILLFSAFFVLFATMFPTLSEAVTGERLTVGPPFFNKWMMPIGLDPAVPDRRRPAARLAQVDARATCAISSCGRSRRGGRRRRRRSCALGVRVWASGLCFALCAFVVGTIVPGVLARRAACGSGDTGTDVFTALDRPRRPQQAPLRRLHRARRHRADVPRLRRQRLQAATSRCC